MPSIEPEYSHQTKCYLKNIPLQCKVHEAVPEPTRRAPPPLEEVLLLVVASVFMLRHSVGELRARTPKRDEDGEATNEGEDARQEEIEEGCGAFKAS
jgi:hypothetical protein